MATIDPVQIEVKLSEELKSALQETREELQKAKEDLSEERIRTIVQEELVAWESKWSQRIKDSMKVGGLVYRQQSDGTYRADK